MSRGGWWTVCPAALACLLGCGEGEMPLERTDKDAQPANEKKSEAKKATSGPEGAAEEKEGAQPTFTDSDFVESGYNRDPFRSFETSFQIKAPATPQRRVLMPEVGVDQMRLIAIISGVDRPRAMLVDPSGVGHVASRGDFIGRAEVVQTGGRDSLPVTLNWRVDRIRAAEVVLAREDPSNPGRASMTRVLPLYDETDIAGTLERSGKAKNDVPEFGAKRDG